MEEEMFVPVEVMPQEFLVYDIPLTINKINVKKNNVLDFCPWL